MPRFSATTTTTTTTPAPTTTPDPCVDYEELCKFWAAMGECERNPFWMRPHCQRSCRSCAEDVSDVFAPVPREGCENSHAFCTFWAHSGECEANANWMMPHCALSCNAC